MARAPKQEEAPPQADQIEGLAHPRSLNGLVGHRSQQQAFNEAVQSGRLHHAWLLTGPKGVGKASFAYHAAARLLDGASPPFDFSQTYNGPCAARLRQFSHGDLKTLSRPWNSGTKKFRNAITVDEVRGLVPFFGTTSAEEGYRIAVVDCAEDMNRNAANALLKLLEEPPRNSLFFLISHAPGRLLPTIRSRCRQLRFEPLPDELLQDVVSAQKPDIVAEELHTLGQLAQGAPGRALELALADGLQLYIAMIFALNGLPRLDAGHIDAFATKVAGAGKDAQFDLFCSLYSEWLHRLARGLTHGAPPENLGLIGEERSVIASLQKLHPFKLVDHATEAAELMAKTRGLNLDRRQMVMTCFEKLARIASGR